MHPEIASPHEKRSPSSFSKSAYCSLPVSVCLAICSLSLLLSLFIVRLIGLPYPPALHAISCCCCCLYVSASVCVRRVNVHHDRELFLRQRIHFGLLVEEWDWHQEMPEEEGMVNEKPQQLPPPQWTEDEIMRHVITCHWTLVLLLQESFASTSVVLPVMTVGSPEMELIPMFAPTTDDPMSLLPRLCRKGFIVPTYDLRPMVMVDRTCEAFSLHTRVCR